MDSSFTITTNQILFHPRTWAKLSKEQLRGIYAITLIFAQTRISLHNLQRHLFTLFPSSSLHFLLFSTVQETQTSRITVVLVATDVPPPSFVTRFVYVAVGAFAAPLPPTTPNCTSTNDLVQCINAHCIPSLYEGMGGHTEGSSCLPFCPRDQPHALQETSKWNPSIGSRRLSGVSIEKK